jgi:hypothetical protein
MPYVTTSVDYETIAREVRSDGELAEMINALGEQYYGYTAAELKQAFDTDQLTGDAEALIRRLSQIIKEAE